MKRLDPIAPASPMSIEEGKIDDRDKYVFREIDGHIVAEKLSRQVLKQQPSEKEIQTVPPVIENGDHDRAASNQYADQTQPFKIIGYNVASNNVSGSQNE